MRCDRVDRQTAGGWGLPYGSHRGEHLLVFLYSALEVSQKFLFNAYELLEGFENRGGRHCIAEMAAHREVAITSHLARNGPELKGRLAMLQD
jgi:hypothetical protein